MSESIFTTNMSIPAAFDLPFLSEAAPIPVQVAAVGIRVHLSIDDSIFGHIGCMFMATFSNKFLVALILNSQVLKIINL